MRKQKEDTIDIRKYWREPRLASRLSKEQRKLVAEIFMELVRLSEERNAKRMGRIMKERNRLLLYLTREMRDKW